MNEKRKIFFTGLLVILLIFSNIIVTKITVVAGLPLSCNFLAYPLTFLCVVILTDLYGAKSAITCVISAVIIQVIVLILSMIVVNLPNQITTIAEANALQLIFTPEISNGIYYPNIKIILVSLLAFIVSQLINIGLFTVAKRNTFRWVSCGLSILVAIIVDTLIFIPLSGIGVEGIPNGLRIVNQFIIGVAAMFISIPLFSLLTINTKTKKDNQKK